MDEYIECDCGCQEDEPSGVPLLLEEDALDPASLDGVPFPGEEDA